MVRSKLNPAAVPVDAPRRGRPVSVEKQQAVLQSAIDEFADVGYDNANMDSIAAKAGVSKRTLYNRFRSKDGLFDALVDELAQRIVLSSTIAYRPSESLRDQLLAYGKENQEMLKETTNVQLLRAVLGEHIRHPSRVEPLLHKYWVTEYGFEAWMQAAKADGRLAGDARVMAHLMGGLMKSVVLWPSLLGRGSPSGREATTMLRHGVDMFLSHFSPAKTAV